MKPGLASAALAALLLTTAAAISAATWVMREPQGSVSSTHHTKRSLSAEKQAGRH